MKKHFGSKDESKKQPNIHGWAYIDLPTEMQTILTLFRQQFPLEWQTDNHGNKLTPPSVSSSPSPSALGSYSPLLHVTFLLRVKVSPPQLDALRTRVAQEPIRRVQLGAPFFETVDRIRGGHVKCIGVPLLDPSGEFVKFRQSCANLVEASVGYPDSVGHISLVYISTPFHELAEQKLADIQRMLAGPQVVDIKAVTLCSQDSKRNTLGVIHFPLGTPLE